MPTTWAIIIGILIALCLGMFIAILLVSSMARENRLEVAKLSKAVKDLLIQVQVTSTALGLVGGSMMETVAEGLRDSAEDAREVLYGRDMDTNSGAGGSAGVQPEKAAVDSHLIVCYYIDMGTEEMRVAVDEFLKSFSNGYIDHTGNALFTCNPGEYPTLESIAVELENVKGENEEYDGFRRDE